MSQLAAAPTTQRRRVALLGASALYFVSSASPTHSCLSRCQVIKFYLYSFTAGRALCISAMNHVGLLTLTCIQAIIIYIQAIVTCIQVSVVSVTLQCSQAHRNIVYNKYRRCAKNKLGPGAHLRDTTLHMSSRPKCQALHIVRSCLWYFYLNKVIFAVLDVPSLPLQ